MSTPLYNYETGKFEYVDDKNVETFIRNKTHTFGKNQDVGIILPNGKGYNVSGEDALKALGIGATFESSAQQLKREYKEEYGSGLGNAILAGGAGLARGLSVNLTDAAMTAQGLDPKILETYREEFGGLSTATEIAGSILPAFFTSGATALGSAARLMPSGALALGSTKIGSGLAKTLVAKTASDSVLRKATRTGLGVGVMTAVESMGVTAGAELSDYVLKDKPKSAEQIIRNIGFSAVTGGGIGVGLGSGAVLTLGSIKAIAQKTMSIVESASNSKLVAGFTDAVADFVAKTTGRDPAETRRMLRVGKKDQAAKFGQADDAATAADATLASIRAEETAIKAQKIRNKILANERKAAEEIETSARESVFKETEEALSREKSDMIKDLSDEEMTVLIEDLDQHGVLDRLGADKFNLQNATAEARTDFLEDNFSLIEAHAFDKAAEIEKLAALNDSARIVRANIRGVNISKEESISEIKEAISDARHLAKNDLSSLKEQRSRFIRKFGEEELDAGLLQLKEQGQISNDILNVGTMDKAQKVKFAEEHAELMFRKASSDGERAELFRSIQEQMVMDRALKVKISDEILEQQEKVKNAAAGAKSEMAGLISNAEGKFDTLAADTKRHLDDTVESMEELNTFFQAGGVTGGGAVKEGFFSQLLPKIGAGSADNTRNIMVESMAKIARLGGLEKTLAHSQDNFFGGGLFTPLLNQYRQKISTIILESANRASVSKGHGLIYTNLGEESVRGLHAKAVKFLETAAPESSEIANRALFRELDDLKRRLQEQYYRKPLPTSSSPDYRAATTLKGIFEDIDDSILKNTEFWGNEAVEMYTEMNSAMSRYLKTRAFLKRNFLEKGIDNPSNQGIGNPGKIGNVLRNITKEGHSTTNNRNRLTNYLDASEALQSKFKKYYPKDVGDAGKALAKSRPGPAGAPLKEGFHDAAKRAEEGIDRVRSDLERAKSNQHSIDAFHAITGHRIHLSDVSDEVSISLRGYSAKLENLADARSELESLFRLRRTTGSGTFEEAKMFAAETKILSASLQKTLKGGKLNEVRTMALLADKRSRLLKEQLDLKQGAKETTLFQRNRKTTVTETFKEKELRVSRDLAKVEKALSSSEAKVKGAIRAAVEEERAILDKIAKETDDLKSAGKLRFNHTQFAKDKLKADRDRKILNIKQRIDEISQKEKSVKSLQAEAKKNFTITKKESSRRTTQIAEDLKREKDLLKADLASIKTKNAQSKRFDDDQISRRELELLARKSAAQEILIGTGKSREGGNLGSAVIAGAIGAVPFGLGGGLMTGMAVAAANPVNFARATTGMWAMTEATEKVLARGIDIAIDGLTGKVTPAVSPTRANRMVLFLGNITGNAVSASDPGKEYAEARERLSLLSQNPDRLAVKLDEITKDIEGADPELASEVKTQYANVVNYLDKHLPKEQPGAVRGVLAKAIPVTDTEIRKAGELVDLAEDPVNVLASGIATGIVSDQQIDMCKNCFPDTYLAMGSGIQEGLAKRKQEAIEKGEPAPTLSYTKRLTLDRAFGGQIESTMSGEFILTYNEVLAPSPQGPANQTKGKNFNPLKKGVGRATLPLQTAMESVGT